MSSNHTTSRWKLERQKLLEKATESSVQSSHLENESSSCPSSCLSAKDPNNAVPNQTPRTPQDPSKVASNNKIEPLLGNPYFTLILGKSQVQSPYQLLIPRQFHDSLPQSDGSAALACQGKTWEVKYCGNCYSKRFSTGWRDFANDNNLKAGDGCVFELMKDMELKFRVQILDGQIPSMFVKRGSSDRPINLD